MVVELGGCEWLNIENCPAPMQLSLIECLGSPPEWDAEDSVCDWSASKLWLREDGRVDICRTTQYRRTWEGFAFQQC